MRIANIERKTKETFIRMTVNIDGSGKSSIISEIGFLNHMLETFAHHGIFDLEANIKGDIHVDQHHTVEDTGITLGEVIRKALGDKKGIKRAGFFTFPMDESLASVAIDISGRPFLKWDVKFQNKKVGDLSTELLEDLFSGFASSLGANLHIKIHYGRSDHHKIEAIFKALAKAMKIACEVEDRLNNKIPSTKGTL